MSEYIEILDAGDPRVAVFNQLNETQLKHYYEPNGGLFITESPKVTERAMNAGCRPVSFLIEKKQLAGEAREVLKRSGEAPVYIADFQMLRMVTGIPMTRGVLCCMERPVLQTPWEVCRDATRIAVLENVTNPTNIGAIFRSAAALGIDAVLLNAACCDPYYRRASRVSMGTVFQIPWTYLEPDRSAERDGSLLAKFQAEQEKDEKQDRDQTQNQTQNQERDTSVLSHRDRKILSRHYINDLHEMGFKTAAMALRDDTYTIDDPEVMRQEKLAVLLGAEGEGLTQESIDMSDYTIKIPMTHGVDSLNVAAASAVAFWQLGHH